LPVFAILRVSFTGSVVNDGRSDSFGHVDMSFATHVNFSCKGFPVILKTQILDKIVEINKKYILPLNRTRVK